MYLSGIVFQFWWLLLYIQTTSGWWFQVSNIFYFHPYLGKWSKLTHIFQMGWNYQLDIIWESHLSEGAPGPLKRKISEPLTFWQFSVTCLGWLSDLNNARGWKGHELNYLVLVFLVQFLGIPKIYHRTRPGMDLTDWLRGPSNREGQFFNRACAHFVSGGEQLGCAYPFCCIHAAAWMTDFP